MQKPITKATNWLLAAVFALLIAAAYNLDDHTNGGGEFANSPNLKELQAAQASTARHKRAAQALCNEARGSNSVAQWTTDNELVCTLPQPAGAGKNLQAAL